MIRSARIDELGLLTDLMHRSKAVWGYDEDFMAAARVVLQVSAEDVESGQLVVFDLDGPQGLCKLVVDGGVAEIDKLFVAPEGMGKGVGRALVQWAIETALAQDAMRIEIEADPGAVPFYQRMGAHEIGCVLSEAIAGRMLPLMQIDLSDLAPGGLRSI
ncbi:GNAT family N-acetyltransferase [Tateyamaria sp. syn59]|uniref:GNAT family N-acetyltransferase n=1 Tax=Tateyamaria sp. syn59 TaxID=2576942 RepID=UPI0011BEF214|nr:GNAT family N-acetyltransferase [Tateyamaria sp. syn59]